MDEIGKMNVMNFIERREIEVEIKLPLAFLSAETNQCHVSPMFIFLNAKLCIEMTLKCFTKDTSEGYLDIRLCKSSIVPIMANPNFPISLEISLGLKKRDGAKVSEEYFIGAKNSPIGISFKIQRSELLERGNELLPSGVLTVFCTMKGPRDAEMHGNSQKCSVCETLIAPGSSKSVNGSIECPRCHYIIHQKDWSKHECEKKKPKALKKPNFAERSESENNKKGENNMAETKTVATLASFFEKFASMSKL